MGYSSTKAATETLAVLEYLYQTDPKDGNLITLFGERYFFERGTEQADGAITGKLMHMLPDNCHCEPVGSVRINPDGSIARFPRLSAKQRMHVAWIVTDLRQSNPQMLSNICFRRPL